MSEALAIVEQVHYACVTRWRFILRDGAEIVFEAPARILKIEAMADRKDLLEQAGRWLRRAHAGYADCDDPEAPLFRVMLRARYETRDQALAPGG